MQYATRWCLQLAAGELKEGRRSLAGIAAEFGYESEAAFARAFKRVMGCTPGDARRA